MNESVVSSGLKQINGRNGILVFFLLIFLAFGYFSYVIFDKIFDTYTTILSQKMDKMASLIEKLIDLEQKHINQGKNR